MSPFAIKMLAVLGVLCRLVPDTAAGTREIVLGKPQVNETVFVGTRQIQWHPFLKRKSEISYPDEFYYNETPMDVIHGIEIYELPDRESCKLDVEIKGVLGESASTVKLKSGRACGIHVRVTFRVHRAAPKKTKTKTKIPNQATEKQVNEETTKIPDQDITEKQVDEVNDDE